MSRKRKLIIISVVLGVVTLLVGGVVGVIFLVSQQNKSSFDVLGKADDLPLRGVNLANSTLASGKVIQRDASSLIVDGQNGQYVVTWDDNTQVQVAKSASQSDVLAIGNNIEVRLADNSTTAAARITKREALTFRQENVPNGDMPQLRQRMGNGEARPFRKQFGSGDQQTLVGEITAIDGNNITIKIPLNDTTRTIDVSQAQYFNLVSGTIADIQLNDQITVMGTKVGTDVKAQTVTEGLSI